MMLRRPPTAVLVAVVVLVLVEILVWTSVALLVWTFRNFSFDTAQGQMIRDLRTGSAYAGWAWAAVHAATLLWYCLRAVRTAAVSLVFVQLADVLLTGYAGIRLGARQDEWGNAALWWTFSLV